MAFVAAFAGAFAIMLCFGLFMSGFFLAFAHSHFPDVPDFYVFKIHFIVLSLLVGFAGVLAGTLRLERPHRQTGSVVLFIIGLAFYGALRMPMGGVYAGSLECLSLESLLPFAIGGSMVVGFFSFQQPASPGAVKKRRWFLTLVTLIVLAVGCVGWLNRPMQKDVIQKIFGNQECFDTFIASQQVTVQRLHWRERSDPTKLSNYDHAAPVPVTPAQAREIRHLMETPSSYTWSRARKTCGIDYDVLFTFRSGQRTTRIALYLKCDILGVFDGEDENAYPVNREEDYDLIRKPLVTIVKSIFPNDPEIQALK